MNKYYEKDSFILYQGSCIEILNGMPENTFDMIFADPPYHLSNDGFTCHAGKAVSVNKGKWDKSKGVEDDFQFHLEWISACKRVLKPGGTIWISGTYHSIYACGFALQKLDYKILNDIVWFKPNASPNLSCRYFTASHETLLWARKGKKIKHTFNYTEVKKGKWGNDFIKNIDKQMRSVWAIDDKRMDLLDTWKVPTTKKNEKEQGKHPTQKPCELLKRVIIASTNEGDLILDPFTGSSTTGIMANKLGRKFVGIDIECEYLDLSIKRFKDMQRTKKEDQCQ